MRRLALTLGLLALAPAACGGGGGGADVAAAPDCEVGETDGDLTLFNWAEYIDPTLLTTFEEEHGIQVIEEFFSNNDELSSAVSSGAGPYDVIIPSDYTVGTLAAEGTLMPLQQDALPNLDNLSEDFENPPYDPDNQFSAAYQWGTTGLAVDTTVVGEDFPHSWSLLFDAESLPSGTQVSLLDESRETMAAALRYLGYSINTTDEGEIAEAADLIAATRERVATFDSDQYEESLLGGVVGVSQGWSGDFFAAFDEASTDEFDAYSRYSYVIPDEGSVRWVDNMAIPANAAHPCSAHTFMNFVLDAENGAALTNWNFYASPNAAAEEFIDPVILEDESIYPSAEAEENLEFVTDVGAATDLYTREFARAKG